MTYDILSSTDAIVGASHDPALLPSDRHCVTRRAESSWVVTHEATQGGGAGAQLLYPRQT